MIGKQIGQLRCWCLGWRPEAQLTYQCSNHTRLSLVHSDMQAAVDEPTLRVRHEPVH